MIFVVRLCWCFVLNASGLMSSRKNENSIFFFFLISFFPSFMFCFLRNNPIFFFFIYFYFFLEGFWGLFLKLQQLNNSHIYYYYFIYYFLRKFAFSLYLYSREIVLFLFNFTKIIFLTFHRAPEYGKLIWWCDFCYFKEHFHLVNLFKTWKK